jgi:hypothetical protein
MRLIHSFSFNIRSAMFLGGLLLASSSLSASSTKASAPAKSAAPVRSATPARSPGSGSGAGAARGGARGPTTSHPGPTTANGGHGITTATAGRGVTTANVGRASSTTPAGAGRGARAASAAAGGRAVRTADGKDVRMRANGQRSDLHDAKRGMDVHRGLNGDRRVSMERPDHSRIVAERGGRGYVQHPYMFRGHEFAHRTYYFHGRAYDRFYRRYPYRGAYLEVYSPFVYYPVGFYGWVYNPWLAPVPYAWGFAGNPWYGYYGSYFAPEPVYPNASMWLTDYMVSNELQNAYQARVDAQQPGNAAQLPPGTPPPAGGPVALSPEVKQSVAEEVRRQLALENSEAQANAQSQEPDPQSSGIARMLTDGSSHVFVVGRDLDLLNPSGQECAVSPGDVLQLQKPPAPNAPDANLVVLASKGSSECGKASTVSVTMNDLQDMQNQMRETIDQGLADLQSKQGKGGLPVAPPSAKVAPVQAVFADGAPPPDPTVAAQIGEQAKEADKAEQEVAQVSSVSPAVPPPAPANPSGPPPEISLGQTMDQVSAALGSPTRIVDLGSKKIYVYKDMKVTFSAGNVSDIQ